MAEKRDRTDRTGSLARGLYLDLMKRCVTNSIYDPNVVDRSVRPVKWWGWPEHAHSMLSVKRLDNIQFCVESVLRDGIPGDLIETGVWRGGATIFMRAVLKAHGVRDRTVWVADSFEGLPPPDPRYPADSDSQHHVHRELAISLDVVTENFRKYDLLDDQVRFLKGWFSETLAGAPIERLAVLRLDGDMYESTMDALTSLYPKLSPGGYLIVDDYGAVPACKAALHDFRDRHHLVTPIEEVDWTAVYWRKPFDRGDARSG
jgi:O-methyltransferase